MGTEDDCQELKTMKKSLDIWLKDTEEGMELVYQNYEIKPEIVGALMKGTMRKLFME